MNTGPTRSRQLPIAALAVLVGAALLPGCGGSMSALLDGGPTLTEQGTLRAVAAPAEGKPVSRMIAYRPAIGPPDDVGGELSRQLIDAAVEKGIALILDPSSPTDLALRGYLTAMRKGPTVNVSYLWDLVDTKGQRVHRISGEEALSNGVDVKQPWAAVTPAVARMIAQKAMSDISNWASTQPLAPPPSPPPATVQAPPATVQASPPPAATGSAALALPPAPE